jgi:hypothetical protein
MAIVEITTIGNANAKSGSLASGGKLASIGAGSAIAIIIAVGTIIVTTIGGNPPII